MRKIINISMLGLACLLTICPQSFSQSYVIFMPDSIRAISRQTDLEPFLTSDKEGYRVWGTYRLGQIGTESDIDRLLQLYENEPHRNYYGTPEGLSDGVKYYSIIGMSKIGGSRALTEILDIAQNYGVTQDKDSIGTLSAICRALAEFSNEKSYNKLRDYYEDNNLDFTVREAALSGIYVHDLRNPEYKNPSDSVEYLFNRISDNFSTSILDIEDYIITEAVSYIFYFKINNPDIVGQLESRVADINDNENLKKFLQRTVESMNQRLMEGGGK